MDIGLCWSAAVLEHKLERFEQEGVVEEVWNCRSLPQGLDPRPDGNRLFIAVDQQWVGFFRLVPEVLYNPEDSGCPYAIIFDAKSWRRLPNPVPCRRFRGWTYKIPLDVLSAAGKYTTQQ